MEQPDAAEGHRDVVFIAGVDDLLVADGAAGLNDGGHAGAAGPLDVVAEGEERIRTEGHAGDLAEVGFLFLRGQGGGLLGEGLGPDVVADDILRRVADVNVDGVVAVGLRNIVPEGQGMRLCWPAPTPMVWPL